MLCFSFKLWVGGHLVGFGSQVDGSCQFGHVAKAERERVVGTRSGTGSYWIYGKVWRFFGDFCYD